MVRQIIKEAMDKNPLGLKESVAEELQKRVTLALEAKVNKMKEQEDDMEDEMDDEEEDEDEDDMDDEEDDEDEDDMDEAAPYQKYDSAGQKKKDEKDALARRERLKKAFPNDPVFKDKKDNADKK